MSIKTPRDHMQLFVSSLRPSTLPPPEIIISIHFQNHGFYTVQHWSDASCFIPICSSSLIFNFYPPLFFCDLHCYKLLTRLERTYKLLCYGSMNLGYWVISMYLLCIVYIVCREGKKAYLSNYHLPDLPCDLRYRRRPGSDKMKREKSACTYYIIEHCVLQLSATSAVLCNSAKYT